jgi:hypothetical protein
MNWEHGICMEVELRIGMASWANSVEVYHGTWLGHY